MKKQETTKKEACEKEKKAVCMEIEEIEKNLYGYRTEIEKLNVDLAQSDVYQKERQLSQEKMRLEQEDNKIEKELDIKQKEVDKKAEKYNF